MVVFAIASFIASLVLGGLALWFWIRMKEMSWEIKAAAASLEEAEKTRIAIVQALQTPPALAPRPVPSTPPAKPRRVARTFGEYQKAAELMALPMGMKEKHGTPNT